MLKLPIYLRGSSYYLHTRINGKQVKRSLGTSDRLTAMIRACQLLNSSRMDNSKLPASLFNIDPDNARKYEIDLSKGVLRSDGPEDHARMLEALALLKQVQSAPPLGPVQTTYTPEPLPQAKSKTGLKLMDLIDKFFLLKSHSKPATVVAYKNVAN